MELLGVPYHVVHTAGPYGTRFYVDAKKARQQAKHTGGTVFIRTTRKIDNSTP